MLRRLGLEKKPEDPTMRGRGHLFTTTHPAIDAKLAAAKKAADERRKQRVGKR